MDTARISPSPPRVPRSGAELALHGAAMTRRDSLPCPLPASPVAGGCGSTAGESRRRPSVKKHHHKHNLKHRYELLETLGRGTYGKVKKAIERDSGREVAIKSIRKEKIRDEQDMVHIRREIEIMSSLKHPHIISVYEVFENKDKIVIVMEYASKGELYDYISERRRLGERETRHFFRQIVSAVHYCHKNGVVHRDLKLENVLLDDNCNIKIADFGLSNLYHKDRLLQTFCGSPLYASPEIVNGRPYRGPEVDSWALGVLLYTLVYGSMPFDGGDHKNLIRQITSGEYREPTQSSDARGLIRWMLMVNPERRATVEDIASHWWVNWGCKSSVCDCDAQRESASPLLARFIDWQNRAEPRMGKSGSVGRADMPSPTSPSTPVPASATSLSHQRSVRKNKKDSEAGAVHGGDKPGLKRPKSILKTRASGELRLPGGGWIGEAKETGEVGGWDGNICILDADSEGVSPGKEEEPSGGGSPAKMASSLPKKGILKNNQQRESGYYSSPERSESSELLGGTTLSSPITTAVTAAASPQSRAAGRKGILKRNGKYSTLSALPSLGPTGEVPPRDSGLSRSQSRPSSVVSDDSTMSSSDSFHLTDWPQPCKPRIRSCVSAEDLLQLRDFRGLQAVPQLLQGKFSRGARGPRGSLGDNGSFSLLGDLDDMTQVYQQALDINSNLT
ncbi:NUAK family SNF1-like kinase 1 isoform X2 [Amia ocellicauda]|uniref:NUAK family SNF1-like kinase 1 isoform X2 n=1 Tax=Amia ocellicauda TaxID=2972642 RepID=UPI0034643E5B